MTPICHFDSRPTRLLKNYFTVELSPSKYSGQVPFANRRSFWGTFFDAFSRFAFFNSLNVGDEPRRD